MVNMITALCGYFSGTFVSDTGGTFKSDTPGTFVIDIIIGIPKEIIRK